MSKLRTYSYMKRRSKKVQQAAPDFQAVYRLVDQRSEGRCEFVSEFLDRCPRRASDHHHLVKPRRSHHLPGLIVHLCREHHDRCAWPYKRGRLVVQEQWRGRFYFFIMYAADKFGVRR